MGVDCRPRTKWQPLTLTGITGGFCYADWTVPRQDVCSPFPPCVCQPTGKVFAHTQVRDPHESATACSWHALGTSISPATELSSVLVRGFREVGEIVVRIVDEHRVIIHGSDLVELFGQMTCVCI